MPSQAETHRHVNNNVLLECSCKNWLIAKTPFVNVRHAFKENKTISRGSLQRIHYKCSVKSLPNLPLQYRSRRVFVSYRFPHEATRSDMSFYWSIPVLFLLNRRSSDPPAFFRDIRVPSIPFHRTTHDNLCCLRFYSNSLTADPLPRGSKRACLLLESHNMQSLFSWAWCVYIKIRLVKLASHEGKGYIKISDYCAQVWKRWIDHHCRV